MFISRFFRILQINRAKEILVSNFLTYRHHTFLSFWNFTFNLNFLTLCLSVVKNHHICLRYFSTFIFFTKNKLSNLFCAMNVSTFHDPHLNSMTFQGFHNPFKRWKKKVTIQIFAFPILYFTLKNTNPSISLERGSKICQCYNDNFSNSIIIHQVKTKEIITVTEVWIFDFHLA